MFTELVPMVLHHVDRVLSYWNGTNDNNIISLLMPLIQCFKKADLLFAKVYTDLLLQRNQKHSLWKECRPFIFILLDHFLHVNHIFSGFSP